MKWLLRALVIVLVAVLVSAATAKIAPGLMATRNGPGGFEQRPAASNDPNNGNPQARPARRERGERGGGIFGLGVVLRSLIEISLIVVPFAVYGAIKQRRKKAARSPSNQAFVS